MATSENRVRAGAEIPEVELPDSRRVLHQKTRSAGKGHRCLHSPKELMHSTDNVRP